jgi:hypothetical protein
MSNSKKPTKKEMFTKILSLEAVKADAELTEFVEHELELLANKNIRKPSEKDKAKIENDARLRSAIVNEMEMGKAYTADQLIKVCPTLSVEPNLTAQKVTVLMRDLVDDKSVVKYTEKRKTYYKLSD